MSQTRTPPRHLQVVRWHDLSPGLRLITLGGAALAGFPPHSAGWHIKLMLPQAYQTSPVLPTLGPDGPIWPAADQKPIVRTYSVARIDTLALELDILFVLHGDDGPASRWASRVYCGAEVGIAGPAAPPLFQPRADWFLLVGDLSAYALIRAVLQQLPASACGLVLMEVAHPSDVLPFRLDGGWQQQWLVRHGQPAATSTRLLDVIRSCHWSGHPSVTLAGESHQVVAIREHLLTQRQLARDHLYAVPYWKECASEEHYHAERHRIMDEVPLTEESSA
jgi:NADPH-dependent ferric siderophore reductase